MKAERIKCRLLLTELPTGTIRSCMGVIAFIQYGLSGVGGGVSNLQLKTLRSVQKVTSGEALWPGQSARLALSLKSCP